MRRQRGLYRLSYRSRLLCLIQSSPPPTRPCENAPLHLSLIPRLRCLATQFRHVASHAQISAFRLCCTLASLSPGLLQPRVNNRRLLLTRRDDRSGVLQEQRVAAVESYNSLDKKKKKLAGICFPARCPQYTWSRSEDQTQG